MWDDLSAVDRQFAYLGERSRYVRFPLGGIGAGGDECDLRSNGNAGQEVAGWGAVEGAAKKRLAE